MKRFIILLILITILSLNNIHAFEFYGTRATGMGNSFTVADEDPTAIFYNPSAILNARKELYEMQTKWVGNKEMQYYAKLSPNNPKILGWHMIKQKIHEGGSVYDLFEYSLALNEVPVLDDATKDKHNILNRIQYLKGIKFAYNLKYISEKLNNEHATNRVNLDVGGTIPYSSSFVYSVVFKNILSSDTKYFFPHYNMGFRLKLSELSYFHYDIQKMRLDKGSDREHHFGYETILEGEAKFRMGYFKEKPSGHRYLSVGMTFEGGSMNWLFHWTYLKNYEKPGLSSNLISLGTKF